MQRVILHSDLNSFYANVECQYNPKIRKLPVAVCGDPKLRRGIILTANRIAKNYGIKTGMVIFEAKKLCPNLVVKYADFNLYSWFSRMQKEIYSDYTDKIENYGIDECWLDLSSHSMTFDEGKRIADEIRHRTKLELGLTVSIGVADNKIYAKLGSDMKKPDATTLITPHNYKEIVFGQTVQNLLFVGKKTTQKLNKLNIFTIGDLANYDVNLLKLKLGKWGEYIWSFANGFDVSEVMPTNASKPVGSVGNSQTAIRDLTSQTDVKMFITIMAESVTARLYEQGLAGRVITLYIRNSKLESWSKQCKVSNPLNLSNDIIDTAMLLFKHYSFDTPIRSIGVSVSMLSPYSTPLQLNFLDNSLQQIKSENLEKTLYDIRLKYGNKSIRRAILTLDNKLTDINPKQTNTIHPYSYF